MSSFMETPFEFATDMIAETLCGRFIGDVVKICAALEFRERNGAVQPASLIQGVIQSAVDKDAPIPPPLRAGKSIEGRRAIRVDDMIPLRRVAQSIDRVHVIEKHRPQFLDASIEAVEVRLLTLAIFCAAQDNVALVRGDKDDLLLPIETAKDGVLLPLAQARLDRHAEAAIGPEIKHQDRVAHQSNAPVEENDVHAFEIREMTCARFISRRVVVQ